MKRFDSLFFALCVFLAASASSSCTKEKADPIIDVESVTVSPSSVVIEIGSTSILTASVFPSDATDQSIEWTSSNPIVAIVNDGIVTAISAGEATITASSGGKNGTCKVSVPLPHVSVESLTLDRHSMLLSVGREKTISTEVFPKNASNPSVTWTSSDESIASVENGTVTAISKGKATITATAEGFSATCSVTVIPEGPDNNEIWYVGWGGNVLTVANEEGFGAKILSNEYVDGKGIITFEGDVTTIPS